MQLSAKQDIWPVDRQEALATNLIEAYQALSSLCPSSEAWRMEGTNECSPDA